jgi:predicted RecB family nuclease
MFVVLIGVKWSFPCSFFPKCISELNKEENIGLRKWEVTEQCRKLYEDVSFCTLNKLLRKQLNNIKTKQSLLRPYAQVESYATECSRIIWRQENI